MDSPPLPFPVEIKVVTKPKVRLNVTFKKGYFIIIMDNFYDAFIHLLKVAPVFLLLISIMKSMGFFIGALKASINPTVELMLLSVNCLYTNHETMNNNTS